MGCNKSGHKKKKFNKKKKKVINKKRFSLSLVLFVVAVLAITGGYYWTKTFLFGQSKSVAMESEKTTKESDTITQKTNACDKEVHEKNDKNLILANKTHPLGKDYVPADLVIPRIPFASVANDMVQYITREAACSIEEMFGAAKRDGVTLLAVSGYRSYDYQVNVYNQEVRTYGEAEANEYVAIPGKSEHQTGLVMDISSADHPELDEKFETSKGFRWIQDNMYKFGFILRYPKGKENVTGYGYEPWHIRYVGKEAAKEIHEKGITLEEYLGKI